MANLNQFDLNLLVALDTLLTERSVTRAAERLCVTQPALSGSLQRLRYHFNDQLMIRVGREMELTPKARALIEPVRAAILAVESALEARVLFEPESSRRTFRIAMSDYCVHVFLPDIVRRLTHEAPGVKLIIENVFGPSFSRLEGGDIDAVVTHSDRRLFGQDEDNANLLNADLFEDSFVCLVCVNHPVRDSLSLDDYQRYPHALAHFGLNTHTVEEVYLERLGIVIKDQLLIPGFGGLAFQLPGTELITTIQRKLALALAKDNMFRVLESPVKIGNVRESLTWHRRNDDDPGHRWIRNLLIDVGKALA